MMNKKAAILTPFLDILGVGGLSVLLFLPIIFYQGAGYQEILLPEILLAGTIINGAHFMASYRLLYSSRAHIKRYPWASMYVPAALVAYSFFAVHMVSRNPDNVYLVNLFLIFVAFYLALHYTGQAWGMMASFSYLEGIKIGKREHKMFKFCLKVLLGWQVIWSINRIEYLPEYLKVYLPSLNLLSHVAAIGTLPLGIYAFYSVYKSTARIPSLRVTLPFFCLYVWYALMAKIPASIKAVQVAHAVQYLSFPARVELNRFDRAGKASAVAKSKHMGAYALVLLGSAYLVFVLWPEAVKNIDPTYSGLVQLLIAAINVHHFFIDGVIWKLQNPIVRDDIFAHVKPASA